MPKKKVVFLGSKTIGYKCLEFAINQSEILDIEIIGVLTNSRKEFGTDYDLRQLATDNHLPIFDSLTNIPKCDILYSVQYHEILKQEHIDRATEIAINLHMAPLPEYRGSNQFSFAIIDDKKEFGTTIHQINTGVDNGDILFQKRFPIPDNCWVNELYDITFKESLKLFQYTLGHIIKGNYKPLPQEMLIPKYGTSFHLRKEMANLKTIDLKWEKDKIDRYIRATSMPGFEPPYCIINGEKIHFTRG